MYIYIYIHTHKYLELPNHKELPFQPKKMCESYYHVYAYTSADLFVMS